MKRVYKPALPAEKALELMERSAPDDFDPEIFSPFASGVRVSLTSLKKKRDAIQASTGAIYMIDADATLVKQIQETRKQNTTPPAKKTS